MKNKYKTFFDSVKTIIGSQQPILKSSTKAVPSLPGHIMCIYTDVVTLRPIFELLKQKIYKEAEILNLKIEFDLPTRYNGRLPESIDREKRFLSVAVYDKCKLDIDSNKI